MAKGAQGRKDHEQLLAKVARTPGWRVERTRGGHVVVWPPNGAPPIFTGSTTGAGRGTANHLARLKRAGWVDPDEKRKGKG